MSTTWLTTMKPTFQNELLALPPKLTHQVLEKVTLLTKDPRPDGVTKKKLKHVSDKLHRIRSGDYRIFYTYEEPYVSLLALRKRDESTYGDAPDVEFLGGSDPDLGASATPSEPDWEKFLKPPEPETTPLPEPITEELLTRLRVPEGLHPRLTRLETREALYDCPGVPEEILLQLDEVLFERPLEEVLQQPDFLATDVSDLVKFKEGNLLGFLLKLNPEQEKFVDWAVDAKGPTLVKGGPGTGKSTVALYRVRSLLRAVKGGDEPRLLFTTYTNALVNFSRQLLEQLLGEEAARVEVRTADSLVVALAREALGDVRIAPAEVETTVFDRALATVRLSGNSLAQRAQRQALERLGPAYLREEVHQVIEARGLEYLDDYLQAPRAGRRVGLNANQRRAVWQLREHFNRLLERDGIWTWHRLRRVAAAAVDGGSLPPYDAVVVDEAQDLDPIVLGILTRLCKAPNRLFVTADANQSIYGSGFRWTDVHESLNFRGRTGVLRANHRSTREIGEAAQSYLLDGALEENGEPAAYVHSGPLPAVRTTSSVEEEAALLARYLPGAAREFRLGIGSCGVLVPSQTSGRVLAERLQAEGIAVEFMTGKTLDLNAPVAKVITLKSAKGLEFPVVALAGFAGTNYPWLPADLDEDARAEWLSRERRSVFVAMTRAMRALLVLPRDRSETPLFEGFDPKCWNTA